MLKFGCTASHLRFALCVPYSFKDVIILADSVSYSWFCVFNNPAEHGYEGSPQDVCHRLRDDWIEASESRTGAWAYCISADGLHHVHMVLEDDKAMRFSTIKKSYAHGMHFEPTKGTKKQADDYINKRAGFEEKGESIEYICYHGEIKGRQGQRSDIRNIFDRLKSGETPNDILADTPTAYLKRDVLKSMYMDMRSNNTPLLRDLKVFWHFGSTGSGKSYSGVKLANEVGEKNIFFLTVYGSGQFDKYMGQKILWMDDFRGQIPFDYLLRLLDKYKCELQCRFSNSVALWDEVHITSPLMPSEVYTKDSLKQYDDIRQLLRRITSLIYHVRGSDGRYYQFGFDSTYTRYDIEAETENLLKVQSQWIPDMSYNDLSQFETILDIDE